MRRTHDCEKFVSQLQPDPVYPKVTFSATVSTPIGDVDGDGMPDAWETQAAQNGQPAHALNKSSALDAATSPLDHAYHRDTPLPRLPASIQAQLLALRDSSGFLSDYSPGTSFATDRFTAAQRAILARVDPDHDGWSNLEEHQHGTPRVSPTTPPPPCVTMTATACPTSGSISSA